jgi:hypothetical protein
VSACADEAAAAAEFAPCRTALAFSVDDSPNSRRRRESIVRDESMIAIAANHVSITRRNIW